MYPVVVNIPTPIILPITRLRLAHKPSLGREFIRKLNYTGDGNQCKLNERNKKGSVQEPVPLAC
jgi:hypothetical protein